MGIFDFFRSSKKNKDIEKWENKESIKKVTKQAVVDQYTKNDDMPSVIKDPSGGEDWLKKDMTGLIEYLKGRPNMERIYNEFTWAIRNGYSVKKYLSGAILTGDPEIRRIARGGFTDISVFLKAMLDMHNNAELKKDYNACIEAIKILDL